MTSIIPSTGSESKTKNREVINTLKFLRILKGKEEVSKRLIGKRARPSVSHMNDLFRERYERVCVTRESRIRVKLWMKLVIAERGPEL